MKKKIILGLGKSGESLLDFLIRSLDYDFIAFDDKKKTPEKFLKLKINYENDVSKINFNEISCLIQSPGIPSLGKDTHKLILLAKDYGVPIFSDVEFFLHSTQQNNFKFDSRSVGVTGTNGKSTITSLISYILNAASTEFNSLPLGNIGISPFVLDLIFSTTLEKNENYQKWLNEETEFIKFIMKIHSKNFSYEKKLLPVFELSSYQLESSQNLPLHIAIISNLKEDHLERHKTFENYVAAKSNIIKNAKNIIIGIDDLPSKLLFESSKNKFPEKNFFSLSVKKNKNADFFVDNFGKIRGMEKEIIYNSNSHKFLIGEHNAENIAFSLIALKILGIPPKETIKHLENFLGLPHRCEILKNITFNNSQKTFRNNNNNSKIIFVNDSKGTNASATIKAIKAFKNKKIILILGGRKKSNGIIPLIKHLKKIEKIFLIGEAATDFFKDLSKFKNKSISITLQNATNEAFLYAKKIIKNSKTDVIILLSPASASFDQFKNFEERGETFKFLVNKLTKVI